MDIVTNAGSFKFRGKRIASGTALAGESKVFTYTLPEARFFTGVVVKAFNSNRFDYGTLQVVYGETVIDEFVSSWGISDDIQVLELYRASVPAGLSLRVVYHNTGSNDVDLWVNAFLHEK